MLVEKVSSITNAPRARSVLLFAIPMRNTTSSSDPNTMNGLRRPHFVTA